jgi:hypothetical protein
MTSPADGVPAERAHRDRRAVAALLALVIGTLAAHHAVRVDRDGMRFKEPLHEAVLRGEAEDPYQYKMWTVSVAIEGARRATGVPLAWAFYANTVLSLAALVLAHHAWLRSLFSARVAALGATALGVLGNVLFASYWHQPYDFWGVSLFCLLIAAVARGKGLPTLCLLALACGVVWDKHLLVPFLWAALERRRGASVGRLLPRVAAFAACAFAVPVAVRLAFPGDRPKVDVTALSEQQWAWVVFQQAPWVLPFVVLLVVAWRDLSTWVRLLWLYVPALFAAYAASRFVLHEPRSFWAFVPVFTATACAWAASPSPPVAYRTSREST